MLSDFHRDPFRGSVLETSLTFYITFACRVSCHFQNLSNLSWSILSDNVPKHVIGFPLLSFACTSCHVSLSDISDVNIFHHNFIIFPVPQSPNYIGFVLALRSKNLYTVDWLLWNCLFCVIHWDIRICLKWKTRYDQYCTRWHFQLQLKCMSGVCFLKRHKIQKHIYILESLVISVEHIIKYFPSL